MKPEEVVEYRIQILATANQFKAGHRICLDITSMDVPTGTGAMTNVEYIPYHVCSSKTVTHKDLPGRGAAVASAAADHTRMRIAAAMASEMIGPMPGAVISPDQRPASVDTKGGKSYNDDDPI